MIVTLLGACAIPYLDVVPYDRHFHAMCVSDAVRRGCPQSGSQSLTPFIPGGVVMATTAYAHLPSEATRVLIAVYTACGIYLDDVFKQDVDIVRCFNQRFVQGTPQGEPVLDCFAGILRELPEHFGDVVSNIMVTSTLNAVTALLLEHDTRGMTVRPTFPFGIQLLLYSENVWVCTVEAECTWLSDILARHVWGVGDIRALHFPQGCQSPYFHSIAPPADDIHQ